MSVALRLNMCFEDFLGHRREFIMYQKNTLVLLLGIGVVWMWSGSILQGCSVAKTKLPSNVVPCRVDVDCPRHYQCVGSLCVVNQSSDIQTEYKIHEALYEPNTDRHSTHETHSEKTSREWNERLGFEPVKEAFEPVQSDALDGGLSNEPFQEPQLEHPHPLPDEPLHTLDEPHVVEKSLEKRPDFPAKPKRIRRNLVALYLFDSGQGTTVRDRSGVQPLLDLKIEGKAYHYAWISGKGFEFKYSNLSPKKDRVRIVHTRPDKIFNALTKSNQMTVEVWCKTKQTVQAGPTRIVTFSKNTSERNFTLGQQWTTLHFRLRSTDNKDKNGLPAYESPSRTFKYVIPYKIRHFVTTFDGTKIRMYKDGSLLGEMQRKGLFSKWDKKHLFILGNEATRDRSWEGSLYLVAIYSTALTQAEILKNHRARF